LAGAKEVRPPPTEIRSRYATDDMVIVKPTAGATNIKTTAFVESFMVAIF
jgi:hypothetical protein